MTGTVESNPARAAAATAGNSPVRILFVWEKIGGQWFCAGDVVLLGSFDKVAEKK